MPGWLAIPLRYLLLPIGVLLLLGAGLVAVAQLRPHWLEAPLEQGLGRLLERRVEIDSIEALKLGRDAFVQVRGLRIANPDWADQPWLLAVDHLQLGIALPSLWRGGPVVMQRLHADGFEVNLLAPADHPPSWQFASLAAERTEPPSPAGGPPLIIHDGRLQSGVLRYRDPDQDIAAELAELDITDPGGDELMTLQLHGSMNGVALSGSGRVGPAPALLRGRDLTLDLQLGWGDLELQIGGTLDDVALLERPDLQFAVSAPRARPLLDALGMTEVRDGALHVDGRLGTGGRGVTLDLDGSLAEFSIALEGSAGRPLEFDDVELRWHLAGPSLREAGAVTELASLPAVPYEVSGELTRAGSLLELRRGHLVVGGAEVDFDGVLPEFPAVDGGRLDLAGRGLDARLLGPVLHADGLPDEPFELHGSLRPGNAGAALLNLELANSAVRLAADGALRSGPGWHGSEVSLRLSGANLAASLGAFSGRALPPEPFEFAGTLASSPEGFRLRDGQARAGTLAVALSGSVVSLGRDAELFGELSATTPDLAVTLRAWGVSVDDLQSFPVNLHGRLEGSAQRLRLSSASLEAGASRGSAQGLLGDLADPADFELEVALSGPDLRALLALPGPRGGPEVPFDLAGTIVAEPPGWALRRFAGHLGSAEIALDAALAGAGGSRLAVSVAGESLADAAAPWLAQALPAEPFRTELDLVYRPEQVTVPRLHATLGGLTLSGQLDLSNPAELGDTRGGLTLRGPSALSLLRLLGVDPDVPDGPVRADVVLQGGRDGIRLSEIDVALADSDLGGTAQWHFADEGQPPRVDLDLHSRTLYLPFLFPQQAEAATPGEAAPAMERAAEAASSMVGSVSGESTDGRPGAERLIPDTALNFDWLRRVNGRVRYRVDDVVVREGLTSATEADVSIQDGVLQTRRLAWEGNFSTGAAEIRLAALDHGGAAEFYLHSRRIPLLWLLAGEPDQRADRTYRVYLSSHGATLREMAANLEGAVAYRGGGGRISNGGLSLIFGDLFNELFARINPFYRKEPDTDVVCGAGAVRIDGGVIDVNPGVVFRTDKVDVAAGGSIDLRDEGLNVTFSSRARRGIGISAAKAITPYVKLGGTLAQPRLVLDTRGAAVSGGAAVATAGLSIIAGGLWDRWVATAADPCERLFTQISEETRADYAGLLERPDMAPPAPDGHSARSAAPSAVEQIIER